MTIFSHIWGEVYSVRILILYVKEYPFFSVVPFFSYPLGQRKYAPKFYWIPEHDTIISSAPV